MDQTNATVIISAIGHMLKRNASAAPPEWADTLRKRAEQWQQWACLPFDQLEDLLRGREPKSPELKTVCDVVAAANSSCDMVEKTRTLRVFIRNEHPHSRPARWFGRSGLCAL